MFPAVNARMENVDFQKAGTFPGQFPRKRLVHACRVACRVACVLHVCCMCVAWAGQSQGHTNHIPVRKRGRHKNFGWQAQEAENLKSAKLLNQFCACNAVLMHLEMHTVSECPRGQKGQEAEKQTKGWMLFRFSESGFFKVFKTIHVMFPPSPNSMLYSELCVWRPSKKTAIFVHSVRHFQAQHWSWGLRG